MKRLKERLRTTLRGDFIEYGKLAKSLYLKESDLEIEPGNNVFAIRKLSILRR
jgi:hypothetical protein